MFVQSPGEGCFLLIFLHTQYLYTQNGSEFPGKLKVEQAPRLGRVKTKEDHLFSWEAILNIFIASL